MLPSIHIGSSRNETREQSVLRNPPCHKRNQWVMNRRQSTSIAGNHYSDNLAGEGNSDSQHQDWVRGAARPLFQRCQLGRRRLLPNWSSEALIAGAGSAPSPLAGEGGSDSQHQDWVRGAARPLIQTFAFERRRCLLTQGEKTVS